MPPKYSHVISGLLFAFAALLLTADCVMAVFVPNGLFLLFPAAACFLSMGNGCMGISQLERDTPNSVTRADHYFNNQAAIGYIALGIQLCVTVLVTLCLKK